MSDDAAQMRQLEAFVIDNPQLDQLETLIAEFNIFEAMGAVRQELRHSDFLGFLLNPAEKHGLGDRFLKRFLISVLTKAEEPPVSPITINITDLSNAIVEREAQHIDILIHDADSGLVCVVENKVFSSEHSNQLERYLQVIKRRFPSAKTVIPVFLTPDGDPPEAEDSPYIPFSYGQMADIITSVQQTQESMLGPAVNTMLEHYVTMLRRYIVSDSDIAQLCQQIYRSHKAAIDLIIEHMPDLRQELSDYLAGLVTAEDELVLLRRTKSNVRFIPGIWQDMPEFMVGTGWINTDATIAFEFKNYQDRLNLHLAVGPVVEGKEYVRNVIFDQAYSNKSVFRGCRSKLSNQWTYLYSVVWLRSKDYKDATLDDLKEIIAPKWDAFLRDVLPQINDHLMRIEFE